MMVMVIKGHECIWGLSGGHQEGEGGKRRMLRVSKMDVRCINSYENSKHCESWEKRQKNGDIVEEEELVKVHCIHDWNYYNEILSYC
jgi:hypothetical protein